MSSLEENVSHLVRLSEKVQKGKLTLKQIQKISREAFDKQQEIMTQLQEQEDQETDIILVQNIFKMRELVWDIIKKIETAELIAQKKEDK